MEKIVRETDQLRLILTDAAVEAARIFLHQQIKSFNNFHSPAHQAIRTDGPAPLTLLVRSQAGALKGGLAASIYWGWLEIDNLWLDLELRGQGYGRLLLRLIEAEAIERDCTRAFLRTFSFQAPGFYQKQGYRVVGQLDDYPPGHSFFWLRKELAPPGDGAEQ